jgi:hypothetical protein
MESIQNSDTDTCNSQGSPSTLKKHEELANLAIDLHAFLSKGLKEKELQYTLTLKCGEINLTIK